MRVTCRTRSFVRLAQGLRPLPAQSFQDSPSVSGGVIVATVAAAEMRSIRCRKTGGFRLFGLCGLTGRKPRRLF
jgi:hypothetical protein